MKKFLTIVAVFMTMICGSIFLVSCSKGYKKMYLEVEYAIPSNDGKVVWNKVGANANFDYTLSDDVYSEEDMAYVLWLRVKVRGTSKKVNSLYVSSSTSTSVTVPETATPGGAFKVLVHNIGKVEFNVVPSQGGEDKAISFGVNIYRELEGISQNKDCVPAVVTGGDIKLGDLKNLISYAPIGETNQTGVDFELVNIGTLEGSGDLLVDRTFNDYDDFELIDKNLIRNKGYDPDSGTLPQTVSLSTNRGYLVLNVSSNYALNTNNNVIHLRATSKYHNGEDGKKLITTDVYVYIVENFSPSSLLVSYNPSVELVGGKLPLDIDERKEVGNDIVIYNSSINSGNFNNVSMYTYMDASIYSFETTPGIDLRVYINGERYYYAFAENDGLTEEQKREKYEYQKKAFGINVTPIASADDRLVGLKFEVNTESESVINVYDIKLELDFVAFDFSASDKKPADVLNKLFEINVETLASGFHINGQGYNDNLKNIDESDEYGVIKDYNLPTSDAKLYTVYSDEAIGMPLNIQATPTNAINTEVSVGFYNNVEVVGTADDYTLTLGDNLYTKLQLKLANGGGIAPKDDNEFKIDFNNKNRLVYLAFNEGEPTEKLDYVYMVCSAVSTPDRFDGAAVSPKYIRFIAKIPVVGAASDIYVYKNAEKDEFGEYLPNNEVNKAYINFSAETIDVELKEITISSKNSKIKFSAGDSNWSDTIKASDLVGVNDGEFKVLHFKTEQECEDTLVVSSPNGKQTSLKFNFVNVVESADDVVGDYNKTYVWTSKDGDGNDRIDNVRIDGVTTGENIELKYLALQSGRVSQFSILGNGKSNTIKSVYVRSLEKIADADIFSNIKKGGEYLYAAEGVIPTYSASAVRISNTGSYFFDVTSNSVGFTSVVLAKAEFFVKDKINETVVLTSKYFLYEIAVYAPARNLKVETENDKETITYINPNYPEIARVNFNIELRGATRTICFSSKAVNDDINLAYGGGDTSIYGIRVTPSSSVAAQYDTDQPDPKPYFELSGLTRFDKLGGEYFVDTSNTKFSVQAKHILDGLIKNNITSISFDVAVYQFGQLVETTSVTKVIYFGDYTKAENIIVVSGIESYNNIYLSLIGKTSQDIQAYANSGKGEVTYRELGYEIYKVGSAGNITPYLGDDLKVSHNSETNTFTVTAKDNGGIYQLKLYAKDSFNTEKGTYDVDFDIRITVSDGKTSETAYLLKDIDDFVKLKDNTEGIYYRLWKDIDISALNSEKYKDWWTESRTFKGHLDGAMKIEDPNNVDVKIYKCYSLIGLQIKQELGNYYGENPDIGFGLFTKITGTITNVIFDNVEINLSLDGINTSDKIVNIGVITALNSGTIENCSVNIVNSSIVFKDTAKRTDYNIGLISGENNGIIKYSNNLLGSKYSRMVDCVSGGKLTITVTHGIESNIAVKGIHVGGVVGQNVKSDAIIESTYNDVDSKSVKELITAVVNIEFKSVYTNTIEPVVSENIAIGGIVGLNKATIKNIAVSGSIVINDKGNVGAIAGQNEAQIKNVANYGTYIKGYSLLSHAQSNGKNIVYYGEVVEGEINQEQNIGGIVGFNNAGIVDNVRVMFIHFTSDEVAVCSTNAQIYGVGNVGGIIGKAIGTNLTRAYVENFVENISENNLDYNIIGNKANVAGLIADSTSSSATLCFVNADFNMVEFTPLDTEPANWTSEWKSYYKNNKGTYVLLNDAEAPTFEAGTYYKAEESSTFNEFGTSLTIKYVYFLGDLYTHELDATHKFVGQSSLISGGNLGKAYIVRNNIYVSEGKIAKYIQTFGTTEVEDNKDFGTETINGEDVEIKWQLNNEANNKRPYLIYKIGATEYVTLTIRPTDIIVKVDKDYFENGAAINFETELKKYEDGIYMQYVDNNSTPDNSDDDRIVATAIVYYTAGANNTHRLVTDGSDKGLIEKTVLPNINGVDGDYAVSIISGSSIASLTDGGQSITFSGVGKVELKFVSIYDRTKQNNIAIFVENKLNNANVFNVSTSAELIDKAQTGERFTTTVGKKSTISLALNRVDGQSAFDSAKTHMVAIIDYNNISINGTVTTLTAEQLEAYFKITPKTLATGGKYALGQFAIETGELDKSHSYIEIPVKLSVHLNLAQYLFAGTNLEALMIGANTELAHKDIRITIYNRATGLTVSSDTKAESGESINIEANLTTGYVNTDGEGIVDLETKVVGENGEKLIIKNDAIYDTVGYILTAENENAKDLLNTAKANSAKPNFNIWDLFESNGLLVSERFADNSGYTFKLDLRLKDEYKYLDLSSYTDREWEFKLNITSDSNVALSKDVIFSFVPQTLIGLRIENYSRLVIKDGSGASEFITNQSESSLVIPGESGLVKIFADYNYSYFENISISSTRQTIDGKEYFIRYQQLVYNREKEVYQAYAGITADGESLTLRKISYSNGDYDGVIFVRTILEDIVGVRKLFTMTVDATTYDLDGNAVPITRTKTVISQYSPGVYISVIDALSEIKSNEKVYLVEENSNTATLQVRVFGYEFNIQPKITVAPIDTAITLGHDEIAITRIGDIEKDVSGAYILKYRLSVHTKTPFKVTIEMSLIDSGNTLTGTKNEVAFYPVPYILNTVRVRNEANGGLTIPINTSKNLELVWTTKTTTTSKIEAINMELAKLNYLNLFHINQVNANGQDYSQYLSEYLDVSGTSFTIKANGDGTYRIESLIKVSPIKVFFELWYGYDLSGSEAIVKFSVEKTSECQNLITHEFNLNLTLQTTEDSPNPINTADDLLAMSAGENYILMEDITLERWAPLNTEIASLDGNGKVINIKSFEFTVTDEMNIGLFGTVSENTILKNVVVNIGSMSNNLGTNQTAIYIREDAITESTINMGLLAGVNKGLIYNCEVISISNERMIEVVTNTGYTLTFGGLVGVNQGNITNSRVGTEYFEKLTYGGGTVARAKLSCGTIYLKAKGIMAGFVGQNDSECVIASSFVANTSVENVYNVGDSTQNRTAGFVATNNGLIAYSYVKGLERNILTTKSTTVGDRQCVIYASGAGSVGGFAFYNAGTIHDCYSNTVCKSNSAGVAGFVYNTLNGIVYQCYSASKVESEADIALATELPFVGVGLEKDDAKKLLTNSNMLNCYYLDEGVEYDTNYIIEPGMVEAKAKTLENFASPGSLNNFSFIINATNEQELNSVWTYSTAVDKNRSTYGLTQTSLPELASANSISRSIRVFADAQGANSEIKKYKYPRDYELGNKNNPYIIRNIDEYKAVFVTGASINDEGKKYISDYVRFIDDISFKSDDNYINIDTRTNYLLGDKKNGEFTLVDGNGMTISDVVINYSEDERGNLGLFSETYNSVIKGLNVKYSNQKVESGDGIGSSTASHVGGIAGIARNAYLIDLNLSGDITLRAHNVVGGVVGKITGINSGLFNITTSLNVQAGNEGASNLYSKDMDEVAYLSYAGGVAGIIDIGSEEENVYSNVNKLTVNASNVRANRAGGIAGYLGKDVIANRLTYAISGNSQIFGREVAGGIVADNFANIYLSQVNHGIEEQFKYDEQFAKYIRNSEIEAIDNSGNLYSNLSTITSARYVGVAGGFVGVNYGGTIENSLTKANIGYNEEYMLPETIGGFVGITYGGNLKYVYAQNYIDLYNENSDGLGGGEIDKPTTVGGIIGKACLDKQNLLPDDAAKKVGLNHVVANNWFDKVQLQNVKTAETALNYVVGSLESWEELGVPKSIELVLDVSSGGSAIINYGKFGDFGTISIENATVAQSYNMADLYYVEGDGSDVGMSTQQDLFNELFAVWPDNYWIKDYTMFMPNLKVDDSVDYIKIEEETDVKKLSENPDKNFILVKNVEMKSTYTNYIVNTNFTGTLIAAKQSNGEYAKFTNIKINATKTNGEGAGFFKQTTKARIANIGFDYSYINLSGGEFTCVGGVSSVDFGSKFEQVDVNIDNVEKTTVDGAIFIKGESGVVNVGSIVGDGEQTKIIGCSSGLSMEVGVIAPDAGNSVGANIGGIIGHLNGHYADAEGGIRFEGLISATTYIGTIKIKQAVESHTIGGIVGYAEYTRISDSRVGKVDTKLIIGVNTMPDKGFAYVGGIVGSYEMCSLANCSSFIKVEKTEIVAGEPTPAPISEPTEPGNPTTYIVGGIVGLINNKNVMDKDIDNCYSSMEFTTKACKTAYVGGIVGQQGSGHKVIINNAVSSLKIPYDEATTNSTPGTNLINGVIVGGIVALNIGAENTLVAEDEKKDLEINHSMAILNCDIEFGQLLIGGGLIGQTLGSYTINNSTAMGLLSGNNSKEEHITSPETTQSLTVLGGLVGLVSTHKDYLVEGVADCKVINSQTIINSYSALTLSKAGIYQGTVNGIAHKVYSNALVGYAKDNSAISITKVIYSSDYNLALEDNAVNPNKFATQPINVTANVLLEGNQTLNPELDLPEEDRIDYSTHVIGGIGDGWYFVEDHLPVPMTVRDTLCELEILNKDGYEFEAANLGKCYSPIIIGSQAEFVPATFDESDYNYYSLQSDVTVQSSNMINKLNGVLMGNNRLVKSKAQLVKEEVAKNSAVSNLTFNIEMATNGAVAHTNIGTIFMCGVQYNNIDTSDAFGGIVGINKGVISHCFNIGNSSKKGSGIAGINENNASIENSYFTGSFAGGSAGWALVKENKGHIYNSYAAGMAKTFIENYTDGRYEKVYYDYYAIPTQDDVYSTIKATGIVALPTSKMQETKSIEIGEDRYNSDLFNGWKVYSMLNSIVDGEFNKMTYNYGYPIHNIDQRKLDGNVININILSKPTGDGTFTPILDDENPITNEEIISKIQGNIVKGQYEEKDAYYHDASFLLNNIGVMSLINNLDSTEGLYFELEIDIDLKIQDKMLEDETLLLSQWPGIGISKEKPFTGIFNTVTPLASVGETFGSKEYTMDTTHGVEGVYLANSGESNKRTIKNLTGGPLFNNVGNGAVIANIKFDNSKVTSAPLIETVISTGEESANNTTIYNIEISEISNHGADNISGLIKTVDESAILDIKSVVGSIKINALLEDEAGTHEPSNIAGAIYENNGEVNIINSFTDSTISINNGAKSNIAGFITRNSESGKIQIDEGFKLTLQSETQKHVSVSGFVGINDGLINAVKASIKIGALGEIVDYIAGFVGTMNDGEVGGFEIEFSGKDGDPYISKKFGGVAVILNGGSLGIVTPKGEGEAASIAETGDSDGSITVNLEGLGKINVKSFGGIVCDAGTSKGSGFNPSITNVKMSGTSDLVIVSTKGGSGYGLIIANYYITLAEINFEIDGESSFKIEPDIEEESIQNSMPSSVGAIIGYAENGTFAFTCEKPDLIKVYGAKNVGGFIGHYNAESGLTVTDPTDGEGETAWPISEYYASVEVTYPEESLDGDEEIPLTFENFGGLFGNWDCEYTLSGVINSNTIFNELGAETEDNWFANKEAQKGGYDCIVKNIGGVVGKSRASISYSTNASSVGIVEDAIKPSDHGINPINGTADLVDGASINKFMQFVNVGGIVGLTEGLNIENCNNQSQVMGMYAVGGLVGHATGSIEIKYTEVEGGEGVAPVAEGAETDSEIKIIGLVDVGGIIGKADGMLILGDAPKGDSGEDEDVGEDEGGEPLPASESEPTLDAIDTTLTFTSLIGVTNVGGVVGSANSVIINGCIINNEESEIMGNYNVGGLIGYDAGKTIVINASISGVVVYGTVFDYQYENKDKSEKFDKYYFLPSNIGGVIGYTVSKTSEFKSVTTSSNVRTDENFYIKNKSDGDIVTVNMTHNYIPGTEGGMHPSDYTGGLSLISHLEAFYQPSRHIAYDAMQSGIGGFAGRLNTKSANPGDVDEKVLIENCLVSGDVSAIYGVNVGGMVGYLEGDPLQIELPEVNIKEDADGINVAGKLFVGGYIGTSLGFSETGTFFGINDVSIINIQTYIPLSEKEDGEDAPATKPSPVVLAGSCIGGVIGYVKGNISNIELRGSVEGEEIVDGSNALVKGEDGIVSKIRIYNTVDGYTDSSYVGTLVGMLDGNMENCSISPYLCDVIKYGGGEYDSVYDRKDVYGQPSIHGIIVNPKVYNYGGLVGLANVRVGARGEGKLKIYGKHYYAFTVDMVQNRDYEQGTSSVTYKDVTDTGSNEMIVALSHYINTSDISISASGATGLYSNANDYNPLNPTNTLGWAKEYTLFRKFARVIDQFEDTGDSVQEIYNAQYVNRVKTTYKSQPGVGCLISDKIIYTVYQPLGQTARMFTEYGIATLKPEDINIEETISAHKSPWYEPWFAKSKGTWSYEKNYQVTLNDGIWTSSSGKNRNAFWHHCTFVDFNIDEKYIKPKKEGDTTKYNVDAAADEETHEVAQLIQHTLGYTYFVDDDGKTYIFETLFGRVSTSDIYLKEDNKEKVDPVVPAFTEDTSLYSKSGSIFEVTGVCSPYIVRGITDREATYKMVAKVAVILIVVVIFVVASFITGGGPLAPAVAAVKYAGAQLMATKAAGAVIALGSKFLAWTSASFLHAAAVSLAVGMMAMTGITSAVNTLIGMGNLHVEATYSTLTEASQGYLTSSYARQISYDGEMLNQECDEYMPFTFGATLNMESGAILKNNYEALQESGTYSNFEKYLCASTIRRNEKEEPVPEYALTLNYYRCNTGRNIPQDINATIEITVNSMEGDVDVREETSSDYNPLKRIFTGLGVKSYTIPKYQKFGEDLYSYSRQTVTDKRLLPNYSIAKSKIGDIGCKEYELISHGGYAYVMQGKGKTDYVVPAEDLGGKDYVEETFDIDRTIDYDVAVEITRNKDDAIDNTPVQMDDLKWRVDTGYTGELAVNTVFKYNGTSNTGGVYVTRPGIKVVNAGGVVENVYYQDSDKWYKTDGSCVGDTKPSIPTGYSEESCSVYFTLDGTVGTATVNVTLRPDISESGLTSSQVGVHDIGTYYYKYSEGSGMKKSYNFVLCNYFGTGVVENSIDYSLNELPKGLGYYDMTEKVYRINYTMTGAKSIKDFFIEIKANSKGNLGDANGEYCKPVTLQNILDNYSTAQNYSFSNEYVDLVKDRYVKNGSGLLCIKMMNPTYLIESKEYGDGKSINFPYIPICEDFDKGFEYGNMHVYEYNDYKLYTRFKYDTDASGFLNKTLSGKTVKEYLMPSTGGAFTHENIVLSESCRVTLSPINSRIYYSFVGGSYKDMEYGSIQADVSLLT